MDLIREIYINNPKWFIENKSRKPLNVLIDILKIYKNKITEKNKENSNNETDNESDNEESDNESNNEESNNESDNDFDED